MSGSVAEHPSPLLVIGELSFSRRRDGSLWIERASGDSAGEGMELIDERALAALLERFYADNF